MSQIDKTVTVFGASGLVGANIVKACLAKGYRVQGAMRNADDPTRTPYLMALPGAAERLTLFAADMASPETLEAPLAGADGVFIACLVPIYNGVDGTPAPQLDEARGWNEIIRPIEYGCMNIMRAAARQGVPNVVICSSTSSTNPPEPAPFKNEIDHPSDLALQLKQKKYTSAEKIVMETAAAKFVEETGQRLCILLPTLMLGPTPVPRHIEEGFMKTMRDMLAGKPGRHARIPAGSTSMAHIDDVAALFLAAYENPNASGRYFAVHSSRPWRDIYGVLAPHVSPSVMPEPLVGEPDAPTGFDFTRRDSLGVPFRDVPTILEESIAWLKTDPFS